jgi:hypothetical protein
LYIDKEICEAWGVQLLFSFIFQAKHSTGVFEAKTQMRVFDIFLHGVTSTVFRYNTILHSRAFKRASSCSCGVSVGKRALSNPAEIISKQKPESGGSSLPRVEFPISTTSFPFLAKIRFHNS